jgi:hypothetical protein
MPHLHHVLKPAITTRSTDIAATPVVRARVIPISMTICESAPDSHHYRRGKNRSDYWHAILIMTALVMFAAAILLFYGLATGKGG